MVLCYHQPVMLQESMAGLAIQPKGVYVDLTFGGGGHAQAILAHLQGGTLVAFDQDADAMAIAKSITHKDFTFIKADFRFMYRFLKFHGITQVDGILADLGVSSHQLETPARGFSFGTNAQLDMRMNQDATKTAQDILNSYSVSKLTQMLNHYGEVPRAHALAQCIVAERAHKPIHTVHEFKAILKKFVPRDNSVKYHAKVFQALRIATNDELAALSDMLLQSAKVLKPKGRLVVLSYHSLEDRLVKNFIRTGNLEGNVEKDFYGNVLRPLAPLYSKPITPTSAEVRNNNRARSAKLRIGQKV